MAYYYKGKHVTIDEENPGGVGICDYSRFIHNRDDLVKQMEWRGDSLVWTGFYVGKSYVDTPNPQLRPPILSPDPIPIRNPRPYQPTVITWSNNYNVTWAQLTGPKDSPSSSPYQGLVPSWGAWNGSSNGVPPASDTARLAALQAGVPAAIPPFSNGAIKEEVLTQPQILTNLQNFNWGELND